MGNPEVQMTAPAEQQTEREKAEALLRPKREALEKRSTQLAAKASPAPEEVQSLLRDVKAYYDEVAKHPALRGETGIGIDSPLRKNLFTIAGGNIDDYFHRDPEVQGTPEFWKGFLAQLDKAVPPPPDTHEAHRTLLEMQSALAQERVKMLDRFQAVIVRGSQERLPERISDDMRRLSAWYLRDLQRYELLLHKGKSDIKIPDFLSRYVGLDIKDTLGATVSDRLLRMQYDVARDPKYGVNRSPRELGKQASDISGRVIQRRTIKVSHLRALADTGTDAAYEKFLREQCQYERPDADTIQAARLFTGYALKSAAKHQERTGKDNADASVAEVLRLALKQGDSTSEFAEAFGTVIRSKSIADLANPWDAVNFAMISEKVGDKMGILSREAMQELAGKLVPNGTPQEQINAGMEDFFLYVTSAKAKTTQLREVQGSATERGNISRAMLKNMQTHLASPGARAKVLESCFVSPESPENKSRELAADVTKSLDELLGEGKIRVQDAYELYYWLEGAADFAPLRSAKIIAILRAHGQKDLANRLESHLLKVVRKFIENADVELPGIRLSPRDRTEIKNFATYCKDEAIDKTLDLGDRVWTYLKDPDHWDIIAAVSASIIAGQFVVRKGAGYAGTVMKYGLHGAGGVTAWGLRNFAVPLNLIPSVDVPGIGATPSGRAILNAPGAWWRMDVALHAISELADLEGDKVKKFMEKHGIPPDKLPMMEGAIRGARDIRDAHNNLSNRWWLNRRLWHGTYLRTQGMEVVEAVKKGDMARLVKAYIAHYGTPERAAFHLGEHGHITERAELTRMLIEGGIEPEEAKRATEYAVRESAKLQVTELRGRVAALEGERSATAAPRALSSAFIESTTNAARQWKSFIKIGADGVAEWRCTFTEKGAVFAGADWKYEVSDGKVTATEGTPPVTELEQTMKKLSAFDADADKSVLKERFGIDSLEERAKPADRAGGGVVRPRPTAIDALRAQMPNLATAYDAMRGGAVITEAAFDKLSPAEKEAIERELKDANSKALDVKTSVLTLPDGLRVKVSKGVIERIRAK